MLAEPSDDKYRDKRAPPWRSDQRELLQARSGTWAHRLTLAAMFVYVGKIADLFPVLAPFPLGKALIGSALIAVAIEGVVWREGLLRDPIARPFLGIVMLAFLTLPFGIWPGNSVQFVINTFLKEVVLAFLLVVTTRTQSDVRRVIWVFVFNALLLDYALTRYGTFGVEHVFLGRNEIAMYSVIALALLLPLPTQGFTRVLKIASMLVFAVSVVMSQSRGSYLGLAILGAVVVYFRMGRRVALSLVVFAALAYTAYVQLPSDYRTSVNSIINYEQDYNVTASDGRIQVWQRGLKMIKEHPLTGVGIANYPVAEGWMHANASGEPWLTAHNSALQIAAEIGLPGLVLFLVLLTRMFKTAWQLSAQASTAVIGRTLQLCMISYAVTGFFLSQGFSVVFYILVALVLSARRIGGIELSRVSVRHGKPRHA